ncbi:nuclear pore complex protein DDB_G0274915 isoform X2 [Zeugodacus cucurbitae]|uniref:nuclear pore complex protein DDB_G0274915 isoform X2 n=1 Tax=Zeugodacus cucurbitae TaxID=28588 RepID=UPI0023D968BB|nr:nuclear pore complex protein DDB_G0274915 isoform X2 [Zeugodacus cucurbitae]
MNNDSYDLALCPTNNSGFAATTAIISAMDCLPIMNGGSSSNSSGIGTLGLGGAHHHIMSNGTSTAAAAGIMSGSTPTVTAVVGSYQQQLANLHAHHPHLNLVGHHAVTPYSNNYPLHHSSSHHHIQSEQTKSLQELQHEVGALLEFRDLVIETFPDLKHKMASMSSATASSTTNATGGAVLSSASGTGVHTLAGGSSSGGMSNSSLVSRREWEPGIRLKRKVSHKEPSIATANAATAAGVAAGELSSSSLTRSRSNSHSGKKEPKSGENNNGSVVQDSGFSTETSSSKEGHSASSTNGAMTGPAALNRLSCHESDDELLNLLDVIHRKSNRLREEMDQLQQYERQNLRGGSTLSTNNNNNPADESTTTVVAASELAIHAARSTSVLAKSSSSGSSNITVNCAGLTPKTFREHVERLNKEDIKQLRKERDRLLDKLAEMEAETLTGRIKAAKMNDQVEELISVKKDLEEQLKLAMAQKLDLSARVQQLQLQQQQQPQQFQSKSSSSQSDYSSQRNFLSSATTVLSTGSAASAQLLDVGAAAVTNTSTLTSAQSRRQHTFQPVVVLEQQQSNQRTQHATPPEEVHNAFHQSASSDSKKQLTEQSEQQQLGRLDGVVSTPGGRFSKCRLIDSKRFAAILLETSVVELQRHLLTLTVQNQVLMQKLDSATKSKTHLAKRLDKSKDDVEDLRFQLEEKNIELEGTKAQLRVLESRIHSVTPNSGAATNSYSHSQNDYETNRSSASTTLMLSRRGIGSGASDTLHYSDLRSATPISTTTTVGQMPAPQVTQISTPSMKAMVHLPMDELQQHSSSTESAHDHELQENSDTQTAVSRLMSASVGGISPFESATRAKKVSTGSRPSKIPLPGSKAAAYFAGKPPSGRPSTAGRSPPSTHTYATSNSSSKSSLCRSTGNLLYSKSPNSLKRADSAQSIRKDNSSLSTNTSRSSTSSSIPLATHHLSNATSKSPIGANAVATATATPSPRVLQNSPLPKLKRESLTSRVRHLDSLSRVHQHNHHSNTSNGGGNGGGSDVSCTSPPVSAYTTAHNNHNFNTSTLLTSSSPTALSTSSASSYIVSSTPKPSAIAAHINATLRKDTQLNTSNYGAQQFLRRATGGNVAAAAANSTAGSGQSVVNSSATARRFSSASVVGARIASRSQSQDAGSGEQQQQQQQQQQSDSDSGKHSLLYELLPAYKPYENSSANAATVQNWRQQQWQQVLTQALNNHSVDCVGYDVTNGGQSFGGSALSPTSYATRMLPRQLSANLQLKSKSKDNYNFVRAYELEEQTKLQQQQVRKLNSLLPEVSIPSYDYYYSNESLRSSDRGSDNLLVTFDYGYSDSLLEAPSDSDDFSIEKKQSRMALAELRAVYPIKEELESLPLSEQLNLWQRKPAAAVNCLDKYADDDYSDSWEQKEEDEEAHEKEIWFNTALTRSQQAERNNAHLNSDAAFKVHHMQHAHVAVDDDALEEYDVDEDEEEEVAQSLDFSLDERGIASSRSAGSANSFYYRQLALDLWGKETLVDDAPVAQEDCENAAVVGRDGVEEEEFFDSLN